jgi:hypothetical protein
MNVTKISLLTIFTLYTFVMAIGACIFLTSFIEFATLHQDLMIIIILSFAGTTLCLGSMVYGMSKVKEFLEVKE